MTTPEPLLARARALQLHGVVSHWAECAQAPCLLDTGKPATKKAEEDPFLPTK